MTSSRAHPGRWLCDRLLGLAARVAPRSERRTWRREWEAELDHRWARATRAGAPSRSDVARLAWRCAGAILHAAWLRGQEWRPDMLMQDLKFALRSLRKRPLFTGVIIATIALGVGVNAAIFSLLYRVVLEPLPYEDPDELVMVWEHNVPRDNRTNVVAPANFLIWRDEVSSLEGLAAVTWFSRTLTADDESERVGVVATNANFFGLVGVQPHRGRFFLDEEDRATTDARPAILSHAFWQRRFGGSDAVLGATVEMNGTQRTVVGVLPPDFRFDHLPYAFNATGTQDVWIPQAFSEEARGFRGRYLQVVGRLADGGSLAQAQTELETIASRLEREFPDGQAGWTVNVVSLKQQVVGDARRAIIILFGAVCLVLLIACGNVANLLLARVAEREQEVAVRTALGANRPRIVRQLLTESGALALAGGAVGVLLAFALIRTLVALQPDVPRLAEVSLDGTVVGFAFAVSLLTGLVFGLLPSLRASRPDLVGSLKEGSARAGTGSSVLRARNMLVVSEIALALVLLVGSGLLIRSFAQVLETGVGFRTNGLMTAEVALSPSDYPEVDQRRQFFERLVDRLSDAPGVEAASAITNLPLSGSQTGNSFWLNDRPLPADGEYPTADIRWVHRDYREVLGIPLVSGRFFDRSDVADAPLRVVINETGARRFYPEGDAVGRSLSMNWGDTLVAEIIGVVGDVLHNGPETEPRPKLYWHHLQFQDRNGMSLVLRTSGDPAALAGVIRAAVREMDPAVPVYNLRPMNTWMAEAVASRGFVMLALGLFGAVALLLASIGIYGVMSYNVSQRTREFGVRLALGAEGRDVALQVARWGMKLIAVALALGLVGAFLLTRVLENLLYGVGARDLASFGLAAAFLVLVAVAACYWPAYRAGRIDPVGVLRMD